MSLDTFYRQGYSQEQVLTLHYILHHDKRVFEIHSEQGFSFYEGAE